MVKSLNGTRHSPLAENCNGMRLGPVYQDANSVEPTDRIRRHRKHIWLQQNITNVEVIRVFRGKDQLRVRVQIQAFKWSSTAIRDTYCCPDFADKQGCQTLSDESVRICVGRNSVLTSMEFR